MHKNLPAWQLIHQSLQQKLQVMLLYVLESKGSSPGRQGFMMAVNENGQMCGSLGGGIMEFKLVELAKKMLVLKDTVHELHRQIHDKEAAQNQSGMICSGEQTIFLYRLLQTELQVVESIIHTVQANQNGTLQLTPKGILFTKEMPAQNFFLSKVGDEFLFIEKLGYKQNLYIIGGGHCSLALAQLMYTMDFYIRLYDDRAELNTMLQNHFVHEKIVLDNYGQLEKCIPSGENNYVVVMTVGYRTDDIAVTALLNKQLAFFGILGSKKKIEKMFNDYKVEGIDEAILKTIHAPVGLMIKSQSPEEIAVSIAAAIIQVKNGSLV